MNIGIPKEIMANEDRISITPAGVFELRLDGHEVLIEQSAGSGSGFSDEEFVAAGAKILSSAAEIYQQAELIVKVKEPQPEEYALMQDGQTIFTYFHLAPNPTLAEALLARNITAIAYETVQLKNGQLPLLTPMSEVAGRMSVQVGATLLQRNNHGSGVLLGGVPGVRAANVLIIGGGTVGTNAARMAVGLGANVTIMDVNKTRLSQLDDIFMGRISTMLYNNYDVARFVKTADLLIGAVLIAGSRAPRTVSEEMVKNMREGSVIVDVAVDQGGSIETIDHVTTHENPYYIKHGVVHYSVANMPGAVSRTSTLALSGVTLPYTRKIASLGVVEAVQSDDALLLGVNTYRGHVTHRAVAEGLGFPYTDFHHLI